MVKGNIDINKSPDSITTLCLPCIPLVEHLDMVERCLQRCSNHETIVVVWYNHLVVLTVYVSATL